MGLPIAASLSTASRPSLCAHPSTFPSNSHSFRPKKLVFRLNCGNSKPPPVELSSKKDEHTDKDRDSELNCNRILENPREFDSRDLWDDAGFVEVIGIGSRKDSVFDYYLNSPLRSPALRFWNILAKDSMGVQLQQWFIGQDVTRRTVEVPLSLQSCSKAIILVASAAYGSDYIIALDILKMVKSAGGLAAGIILKPFGFEGQRRQEEVHELIDKLQKHTNFSVVVDTDTLLEEDLLTLDEALKTANNAVLMAINAMSILVSEMHIKFLDVPDDDIKELEVPELMKILGKCKEAKIGFGFGNNIKTSIVRAMYQCPFLAVGVKDLNGIVMCVIASSGVINCSDVHAILHTFRQITECRGEILISMIHESSLEPNQIAVTVFIIVYSENEASQQNSLFSKLAKHFPFILNIWRKHPPQSHNTEENGSHRSPFLAESMNLPDTGERADAISVDGAAESVGIYSEKLQMLLSNNDDEIYFLREHGSSVEESEIELSEANSDSFSPHYQNIEGATTFQKLALIRQNLGHGRLIAQERANEGVNGSGATPMLDNLRTFKLPVGVKPSEELKDCCNTSDNVHHPEKIAEEDNKAWSQVTPSVNLDELADAGFVAAMDFCSSASALVNGNHDDASRKQGALSVRAASMLEAERDIPKRWSPTVVIKYMGGIYRGRCQGGLPEGKGCLSFEDGSEYDGMWRYGKRSGLGTLYFSNGDVFQGSWRDDVMHGKGWFYFHNGDRWFVNFWKGKANGEGRFYSKLGEVFFGHFKDGWRHGHFLCISIDGARYSKTWDEGVLVSRKHLDVDACDA